MEWKRRPARGSGIAGSVSSPGSFSLEQVSAPVCLGESESSGVVSESLIHAGDENTLDDVDFVGAGAEKDFHDAQVVVPGSSGAAARYSTLGTSGGCSEVNLSDAQLLPVAGLLGKGTSRGQRGCRIVDDGTFFFSGQQCCWSLLCGQPPRCAAGFWPFPQSAGRS